MLMSGGGADGVMPSRPTTWSIAAGGYAYLVGTLMLVSLSPVAETMGPIVGLPEDYVVFLMATPAAVIGAAVWWAFVERSNAYSYPLGAAFGGLTAVLTVVAWVLTFVAVWGVRLVLTGWLLVAAVLAVTVIAGLVSGLPLMSARRRAIR